MSDATLRPLRWWDVESLLPLEQQLFGRWAWSAETFWSAFFSIEYRDVAVFGMVILMFVLRPGGLLGVEIRRDYE